LFVSHANTSQINYTISTRLSRTSKMAKKNDTEIETFSKLSKEEQLRRENININRKKKSMTVV
jgi:hypothetical protein